ncbi:MAG: signal peptide peptidase SppA [Nitrospirae bacterium]|nr:signal peptide peptidase SppA [Nitrospirota bacterium]
MIQQPSEKSGRLLGVLVLLSLLLSGCVTVNLYPQEKGLEEKVVKPSRAKDKILFLPVRGFIGDQHKKGGLPFLGGKTDQVQLLEREFSKASGDPHVKAVVLMIDSPGGTVTASDRLYHRIRVFRKKTGIPVIAFFGDLGASGAYYAAMGADEVWARPTSVVGSIGVMIANLGFEGLMKKVGVSDRTIASGPEKEMGSPLREMTPEDRKIFEGLVSDFYEKFLDVVEKNRKIGGKKLAVLADGRVYTASQAMSAHLIDHVGYRSDLVDHLKGRLGIAHLKLVRYQESGGGSPPLFGMEAGGWSALSEGSLLSLIRTLGTTPLYLWAPGGLTMK